MSQLEKKKSLPDGVWGATLTPFTSDGKIYADGLKAMMDYQIENGLDAFFIGGSTGEGMIMAPEQRMELTELVMDYNKGRIPVIVHVGSADTATAVKLSEHAKKQGADGVCSVIPYYYSMTQDYVREYYKAIAQAAELPVLIYYSPTSSSFRLSLDFLCELMQVEHIEGVKYTESNMEEFRRIKDYHDGEIKAYIGFDAMLLNALTMGANGGIGAWYNVMTKACCQGIYDNYRAGNFEAAREMQWKVNHYIAIIKKYVKGTNHGVAKSVLKAMGIDAGTVMPPILPMPPLDEQSMVEELKKEGFFEFVR